MAEDKERRRNRRQRHPRSRAVQVNILRGGLELTGKLVDLSEWGIGIETSVPLEVGVHVKISGPFFSGNSDLGSSRRARVVHCRSRDDNLYASGLAFEAEERTRDKGESRTPRQVADGSFVDYYEVLQISPNADSETIQRVYRLLAQRYHPDNKESGDEGVFRAVLQAFHVLNDPEKRAAYDAQHRAHHTLRWKIFDQPRAAQGVEAERRVRKGILAILLARRVEQPHRPGVSLRDLEALLSCPREHLEFSLWYLASKGLVAAADNGLYAITANGVDAAEASAAEKAADSSRLLTGTISP